MQKQPSLTIISVTGHSGYTRGSMFAIHRSYLALQEKIADLRCVLISPDRPEDLPEYIKHISCKTMDYQEYNAFVFMALGQFVDTDFALIVQNDGWVIAPEMWTDEFFQYDYIGAPLPFYLFKGENTGTQFWLDHFYPIPEGMVEPQNGGFSLRSKKLLDAPKLLNLPYEIKVIGATDKEPVRLEFQDNNHTEDVLLSGIYREKLEEYGCRFAPRELAVRFSIEDDRPHVKVCEIHSIQLSITDNLSLGRHFIGDVVLSDWNEVLYRNRWNNSFEDLKRALGQDLTLRGFLNHHYVVRIPEEYSFSHKDVVIRYTINPENQQAVYSIIGAE
ncbi:MAG: DUF5672 family protein [Pasteurellaceae bacterium]|nr:DUF5672 family protein [Pasteurellaceae bacterium]